MKQYKVIDRKTNEIVIEYVTLDEAMSWCASMYYFELM
jgi:hypothetical protein